VFIITERPTKRLSVGHRRETLFDRYFSSTILLVRSGCRERLPYDCRNGPCELELKA